MRLNIDLTQGKPRKVFFTSDWHLFHTNVLRFDNRPFSDVLEMHQSIEDKWNEVVGVDDIVIYLGDLAFANNSQRKLVEIMLNRINGEIHFVMGNHDKWDDIKKFTRFKSQQDYLEVRITEFATKGVGSQTLVKVERLFCCMHYPIYSWNKKHHGHYMVHGHEHGNLHHGVDASFYTNRRVIDAGCMLHNYYPITHTEIMGKLDLIPIPTLTR